MPDPTAPNPPNQLRCQAVNPQRGQCELYAGHLDRTDPLARHRAGAVLWADLEQVAAAPPLAQNPAADPPSAAQEPPADAGPHPDAPPHASGVLGRALLVRKGVHNSLFLRNEKRGYWTRLPGSRFTRSEIEDAYAEVREVLLVDPAAAQVLTAAWALTSATTSEAVAQCRRDLAAAVDALTGGTDNPDQAGALERFGIDPAEVDALDEDDQCEVLVLADPLLDDTEECGNPLPCDEHPDKPALEPAAPPYGYGYVFDSDHAGNLWIGCCTCNSDIREVEEGDSLDQLLTAVGAHRCDASKPPRRRTVRCSCGATLVAENAEEWAHQTEDGYGNDGCDEPLPISDERERLHQDLADAETRADRAETRCIELEAQLQWARQPATEGTTLTVPGSPKMIRETLCVAQMAVGQVDRGDSGARHVAQLGRLIDECDRHRPLGPDGKHGDRHTATCGCEDKPGPTEVAEALKAGNVACVQTIDRDLQAFAELPDCTHCDGSGKQVPPGWRAAPAACGALVRHTDIDGTDMEPCGNPLPCPWHPAEGTPGLPFPVRVDPSVPPDTLLMVGTTQDERGERKLTGAKLTGIGASKPAHTHACARRDEHHTHECGCGYEWQADRWYEDGEACGAELDPEPAGDGPGWNRDTIAMARAKLALMTAERDRYYDHSVTASTVGWMLATALGDVPDGAEQIEANPGELAERLIAERDRYRELLAERGELEQIGDDLRDQIRRDTAAATLEWARDGLALPPNSETTYGGAARVVDQWAAEIRTGQRDAPGNPEPDSSEEDHDANQ